MSVKTVDKSSGKNLQLKYMRAITKSKLNRTVNHNSAAMPIQYHFSSGKTLNCFNTATPNLVALSEPCHRTKYFVWREKEEREKWIFVTKLVSYTPIYSPILRQTFHSL